MSARTNYFRLGMFVLIGIILGIAGVIVFGGLQLVPQDMLEVETYMDDSVQGLLSGSKVKMRGVEIGTVDEIGFVASYYPLSEEQDRMYGTWVATGLADPGHFRDHGLWIRKVVECVARGDDVEGLVLEGKLLHDALLEDQIVQTGLFDELLPLLDHRVRRVEPDHAGDVGRQCAGELPGPRGNVESLRIGRYGEVFQHPRESFGIRIGLPAAREALGLTRECLLISFQGVHR